jgi:DNA-binding MarR family transcriptional regulator
LNTTNREKKLQELDELMRTMPARLQSDVETEWPEHELTMAQFKALTLLQSGPKRMGEISHYIDISLSSATNLVGRLESKGLVKRVHDLEDRRVVTCELTEEGRHTITLIWQVGRSRILQIAQHLDHDELDRVIDAFAIILRTAERLSFDA